MLSSVFLVPLFALQAPEFAPPERIMAGEQFLGYRRMYASPAFHDLNGDGILDVVVGDLPGRATLATGSKGFPRTFSEERPLLATDGEQMDFSNW